MVTLKTDDRGRVVLPGQKGGKIFAFEDEGNGRFVLTLVKKSAGGPFPKGSLVKYFTRERDKEEMGLLKGCVQGPSEDQ